MTPRKEEHQITVGELNKYLRYDHRDGSFVWIKRIGGRVRVGDRAGCINGSGYEIITIHGVMYYAHRLAWLYMTGTWPRGIIDHINRDTTNNAWANLREASYSENGANSKTQSNSKSGIKGVRFDKKGWRAQIGYRGKYYCLGTYPTKQEAKAAYDIEAKRLYGEFAFDGGQK